MIPAHLARSFGLLVFQKVQVLFSWSWCPLAMRFVVFSLVLLLACHPSLWSQQLLGGIPLLFYRESLIFHECSSPSKHPRNVASAPRARRAGGHGQQRASGWSLSHWLDS